MKYQNLTQQVAIEEGGQLIPNGQQTYYLVYIDPTVLYADIDEFLPGIRELVDTVDDVAVSVMEAFIHSKCWGIENYYNFFDAKYNSVTVEETHALDTLVQCIEERLYALRKFNPEFDMVAAAASHIEIVSVNRDRVALKVVPKSKIRH